MPTASREWLIEFKRGPSCLYVRPSLAIGENSRSTQIESTERCELLVDTIDSHLRSIEEESSKTTSIEIGNDLGESIWRLLTQHLLNRLVLDLEEVDTLDIDLIHEILNLRDRVESNGGLIKLCGISSTDWSRMSDASQAKPIAHIDSRDEALMASCSSRPR